MEERFKKNYSLVQRLKIWEKRQRRDGKSLTICLIWVSEGKKKENEEESIDKDTMDHNFPKLKKEMSPQTEDSHWVVRSW